MAENTYHYIIFGSTSYYQTAWMDVLNNPYVQYIGSMVEHCQNLGQQLLTRWCFNLRWGKWCPSGIRQYVYQRCMPSPQATQQPLCFLFFECWYAVYTTPYMDYLHAIYPQAKFVWYLQDIVQSNPLFDVHRLKSKFDLVCSYDQNDCQQYSLYYLPTPYSKLPELIFPEESSVDVFFCGHAKNRLATILQIYQSAIRAGLRCEFHIIGVPTQDQQVADGIVYNQPLSYIECVQKMIQSRCIIEVIQQNAQGYTPRLWEAIMYDKHLVTNNVSVFTSGYTHDAIHSWDESMDWSWIHQEVKYPTKWKQALSPNRLLNQLDQLLES